MATIDAMPSSVGEKTQAIIDVFDRYVVPNYRRYPVCLTRGQGSRVWDAEGAEYLDLFPGWDATCSATALSRWCRLFRNRWRS